LELVRCRDAASLLAASSPGSWLLCATRRRFLARSDVAAPVDVAPPVDIAAPIARAVDLVVCETAVVHIGARLVQLGLGLGALRLALRLTSTDRLLCRRLAMLARELSTLVLQLALTLAFTHARHEYRQQHKQDQDAGDDCDDGSG